MKELYVIVQHGTGKLLTGLKQSNGWCGTVWDDPVCRYPNKSKPIVFGSKEKAKAMLDRLPGSRRFPEFYIRKARQKELEHFLNNT